MFVLDKRVQAGLMSCKEPVTPMGCLEGASLDYRKGCKFLKLANPLAYLPEISVMNKKALHLLLML